MAAISGIVITAASDEGVATNPSDVITSGSVSVCRQKLKWIPFNDAQTVTGLLSLISHLFLSVFLFSLLFYIVKLRGFKYRYLIVGCPVATCMFECNLPPKRKPTLGPSFNVKKLP